MDYLEVRRLQIEELPLLFSLHEYNDPEDMLRENSRRMEDGQIEIFALFDGDTIVGELRVGLAGLDKQLAMTDRRAYLYAFRIAESHSGLGLGQFLLCKVLDVLTERGFLEFTIGVEDDNFVAAHIYQKFGFTELLERCKETYQGDSYEYNLYIKRL